ncbi:MAG: hypothetical protein JWP85_404 [Rhodoglobus sp.]|nr:hypothetical protein [Rhodoglobus sp.]
MSANLAYARPLSAPRRVERPRHIEIVATRAQRRARPKLAYAVVTIASLFAIFAAQLLLSIVVSQGAYDIASLKSDQKELLRTEQDLREKLDRLDSTQNLAAQAAHLGMVPNPSPLALNLTSGGVYGMPGSADPTGCGGACNLVPNALTTGIPLVDPAAPTANPSAGSRTAAATSASKSGQPTVVEALPAPVTH